MLLQSSVQTSKNALIVEQAACCVSSGIPDEEMLDQDRTNLSEATDGQRISPAAAFTSPEVLTSNDTSCTTPHSQHQHLPNQFLQNWQSNYTKSALTARNLLERFTYSFMLKRKIPKGHACMGKKMLGVSLR